MNALDGEIREYDTGLYLMVDQDRLTTPKENTEVHVDWWFPVDARGRIAFFQYLRSYTGDQLCTCSVQGNSDRAVVEKLAAKGWSPWFSTIVTLDCVYIPRCARPGHR